MVIAAHNEERMLTRCLRRVCAQSEPFDEIIVVDNASTDRTAEIAAGFPGATVLAEPRKGVTYARKTGFDASLEFNFANHMLPSGGAAGIAYTAWRLGTFGVPASRATIGQLARFAVTFVSFSVMLLAAGLALVFTGHGSALVFGFAAGVGVLALGATGVGMLLLRRRRMLHRAAGFVVGVINRVARTLRMTARVDPIAFVRFADGGFLEVRELGVRPRTLLVPFLLSFALNAVDAGLFVIALAAFGLPIDPALVFVGYGVAVVASMVVVTPNGVGAYEVALIGVLVWGGMEAAPTTAAIVLARVILLLGTIVFGWGFYQHSVATSGAPRLKPARRRPDAGAVGS